MLEIIPTFRNTLFGAAFLVGVSVALIAGPACQGDGQQTSEPDARATPLRAPIVSLVPTLTPTPTLIPTPIASPTPSPAQVPTQTPIPVPTIGPTPTPTPTARRGIRVLILEEDEFARDFELTLKFSDLEEPTRYNPFELAARLQPTGDHSRTATPFRDQPGDERVMYNLSTSLPDSVVLSMRLCATTEHADFYVDSSLNIPCSEFSESAERFENSIYPIVLGRFASAAVEESEPRITLMHVYQPWLDDSSSRTIEFSPEGPHAPQGPVAYMNTHGTGHPGSDLYDATVAHRIQHLFHYLQDPYEERWIDEGLSELAAFRVTGETALGGRCESRDLTAWPRWGDSTCHRVLAFSLVRYLEENYPGSDGTIGDLAGNPLPGLGGISAYLRESGYTEDARDVLVEWALEGFLEGWPPSSLQFGRRIYTPAAETLDGPGRVGKGLGQHFPSFIELKLNQGKYRIEFRGRAVTTFFSEIFHSYAPVWQSLRGNYIDCTLTREFDLRDANENNATLTLLLRHKIEVQMDFLYVLVSTDEGRSWIAVKSAETLPSGILPGRPFGPAISHSMQYGRTWEAHDFDLQQFVGQKILIRLEYVTDNDVSYDGVSFAGARLPAADYQWVAQPNLTHYFGLTYEDADLDDDGGWIPDGFFFGNNLAAQDYDVKLVTVSKEGRMEVTDMELAVERDWEGTLIFDNSELDVARAAIMIIPSAPLTRNEAYIWLSIADITEQL